MQPIPAGGYVSPPANALAALKAFDAAFLGLLTGLEGAWGTGSDSNLEVAIGNMFNMQGLANQLFAIELPGGGGVYGPDFSI